MEVTGTEVLNWGQKWGKSPTGSKGVTHSLPHKVSVRQALGVVQRGLWQGNREFSLDWGFQGTRESFFANGLATK